MIPSIAPSTPSFARRTPVFSPPKTVVRQSRTATLESALHTMALDLGFQGGLYVHLGHALRPPGGTVSCTPARFVATSKADQRLYLDEGALACDPVALRAMRAHTPFVWVAALEPNPSEIQRMLYTRLRNRGIHAGIAVPVQDYAGGPAYLSFYTMFPDEAERLVRLNGPELIYAAAEFHEWAKGIMPSFGQETERLALTTREIECLRLAALGWTSAQSATSLKVTPRTVEFHLYNAAAKLAAPNRVAAVALAVSRGLIVL